MGLIQTLSLSFSLFLILPTVVELLLLLKIKRLVDYFFFFGVSTLLTYCSLTPLPFFFLLFFVALHYYIIYLTIQ